MPLKKEEHLTASWGVREGVERKRTSELGKENIPIPGRGGLEEKSEKGVAIIQIVLSDLENKTARTEIKDEGEKIWMGPWKGTGSGTQGRGTCQMLMVTR